jgi:hypothetical protein
VIRQGVAPPFIPSINPITVKERLIRPGKRTAHAAQAARPAKSGFAAGPLRIAVDVVGVLLEHGPAAIEF